VDIAARTQENDNSFSSRNLMTGKGKELEFPEGWGGYITVRTLLFTQHSNSF